jgi:hypothetical protein
MASGRLINTDTTVFYDDRGRPLRNGSVKFYLTGTTQLAAVYKDLEGLARSPNPVLLDNRGRAVIYLDDKDTYDMELYKEGRTTRFKQVIGVRVSQSISNASTHVSEVTEGHGTVEIPPKENEITPFPENTPIATAWTSTEEKDINIYGYWPVYTNTTPTVNLFGVGGAYVGPYYGVSVDNLDVTSSLEGPSNFYFSSGYGIADSSTNNKIVSFSYTYVAGQLYPNTSNAGLTIGTSNYRNHSGDTNSTAKLYVSTPNKYDIGFAAKGSGKVIINGYSFPTTPPTPGQRLKTNGSKELYWG